MPDGLTVVINAQVPPGGRWGGVQQFVAGLVCALGRLDDGPERYVVLGPSEGAEWLEPYLGPNQRLVAEPAPAPDRAERLKRALGPLRRPLGRLYRRLAGPPHYGVEDGNGLYRSLGADVVHFPFQRFAACDLPTVYNPHDLQHRHMPELFRPEELAYREAVHGFACRHAGAVAAESAWAMRDLAAQYGVEPARLYVVPRGAPTDLAGPVNRETLERIRHELCPDGPFCLYPARTWPHKNHARLLEALGLLRERHDLALGLVCTGRPTEHVGALRRRVRRLGLDGQVRFTGFVPAPELRALYRLARFLVFPSLFEGGGFPVIEAFHEGAPVACSRATCLPECAGDAAVFFDPLSPEDMAGVMHQLARDETLRAALRECGRRRARLFHWDKTGRTYRAIYRKLAGRALSEEDRATLAEAGGKA